VSELDGVFISRRHEREPMTASRQVYLDFSFITAPPSSVQ
jgi:hypothetical protein